MPLDRAQTASDEALIAACARRDPEALEALHRRHYAALYRFCGRLLGPDHPELDDIMQKLFLAVWDSAGRYRPEVSVRAWIFGIAANLTRQHRRGEARRLGALRRLFSGPAPKPAADPEVLVGRQRLLAKLGEALAALPHRYSAVYVMCELEGMKAAEVAEALGVKVGTVWRRLHEARRRLREALEAAKADPQ